MAWDPKEYGRIVELKNGKTGICWTHKERPSVNHWYQCIGNDWEYWKITKDFHSPETKITYYKIIAYYNGDIIYSGHTLATIREIIRDNTYRMVI